MSGRKRMEESYGRAGNRRHTGNGYGQLGLTALCAAGLFSVIYMIKGMYPFGDGSILITDLYSQYAPLLYRFYDVVTGVKNLFLDFSVSGGANLYVDTINEILNPFNYILFLFGRDEIYRAVNVVLLLYVTGAAVSADYFLLKLWPKKRDWNPVLSLCYAFSGYMAYNYQIIKWMYFPVLFPLFMLALYRLMRERRGGLYAFLLGYQLVLSVQLGFMALMFVLFGSGFYFFCCVKKEDRPGLMCRLGLYTLAGVLLSAAVLLPNAAVLLSSQRAEENLSWLGAMKRHGLDDLFERLFQIGHPVLLAMAAALLSGLLRQGVKWKQLPAHTRFLFCLNGFLWLTVLLQPANLLWHMGSYVCFPVRYAYMVLFSGVCLIKSLQAEEKPPQELRTQTQEKWAQERREQRQKAAFLRVPKNDLTRLWFCWLGVVIMCMMGLSLTFAWEDRIVQAFSSLAISSVCPKETGVVCLILALFFVAALCSAAAAANRGTFFSLTAGLCGICFFVMIFLPADYGVRLENEAAYRSMAQQAEALKGENLLLAREKDAENLPLNAALINGCGSLSGYFPTASRRMKEAMEGLGYLVPWVSTRSVGGTAVSDELLRRILVLEGSPDELQLSGTTVLERQEELTEVAAGRSLLERFDGTELADEAGVLHLAAKGRQALWLDTGMTADRFQIRVNGIALQFPESASSYSPHRLVPLGAFEEEEIEIAVTDRNGNILPAADMELGVLEEASWEACLETLRRDGEKGLAEDGRELPPEAFEIAEDRGQIRAELDSGGAQTLFLPFAALKGWKCSRNGETVDIVPVLGGFMGITLSEGHNDISLSFIPPGFLAGLVLTLLAAAGLVMLAVRDRKNGRNIKPGAERACALLYRAVWIGALAAVYVIPAAGLVIYMIGKVLGTGG